MKVITGERNSAVKTRSPQQPECSSRGGRALLVQFPVGQTGCGRVGIRLLREHAVCNCLATETFCGALVSTLLVQERQVVQDACHHAVDFRIGGKDMNQCFRVVPGILKRRQCAVSFQE